MTDINTFFELLVEVCNELPDEFYKELHRGVIVSERTESAPICDELTVLGQYHRSYFGNQITIYYGSFMKLYPHVSEEFLKEKLREVVRHEFRHHLENLAGIYGKRSLGYEDDEMIRRYLRQRIDN